MHIQNMSPSKNKKNLLLDSSHFILVIFLDFNQILHFRHDTRVSAKGILVSNLVFSVTILRDGRTLKR